MQRILHPSVILAVSAALSFGAVLPVQAATVTYDFEANVTQGRLAGNRYQGFFSFDDSLLTGVGQESITIDDGLSVFFTFEGQSFTESDDLRLLFFGDPFPAIGFNNGSFLGLTFVAGTGDNFFQIGEYSGPRSVPQRPSFDFTYNGLPANYPGPRHTFIPNAVTFSLRDKIPLPLPSQNPELWLD